LAYKKDEFEADIDQMVKALEEEIDGKEDTVVRRPSFPPFSSRLLHSFEM